MKNKDFEKSSEQGRSMRNSSKEEEEIFKVKKALMEKRKLTVPEMKRRVANFFGMRWEDTEPEQEV